MVAPQSAVVFVILVNKPAMVLEIPRAPTHIFPYCTVAAEFTYTLPKLNKKFPMNTGTASLTILITSCLPKFQSRTRTRSTLLFRKQRNRPQLNRNNWAIKVDTASQVLVTFSNGPYTNKVVRLTLIKITPRFNRSSCLVFPFAFSMEIMALFMVVTTNVKICTL